jgi:hypothetical protein
MLKLLCSGGKDGSEQMESGACENDRSCSVLVDLSDCLTSKATCSLVSYLSLSVIQDENLHIHLARFYCIIQYVLTWIEHCDVFPPIADKQKAFMVFPENCFHLEIFFRFSITCLFHF